MWIMLVCGYMYNFVLFSDTYCGDVGSTFERKDQPDVQWGSCKSMIISCICSCSFVSPELLQFVFLLCRWVVKPNCSGKSPSAAWIAICLNITYFYLRIKVAPIRDTGLMVWPPCTVWSYRVKLLNGLQKGKEKGLTPKLTELNINGNGTWPPN